MKQLKPETLRRLLYAIHNIGGNASPETDEGIIFNESALTTVHCISLSPLFPCEPAVRAQMMMSGYGRTPEQLAEFDPNTVPLDPDMVVGGALVTLKLWLECMEQNDPEAYAEEQIKRGLAGERVG